MSRVVALALAWLLAVIVLPVHAQTRAWLDRAQVGHLVGYRHVQVGVVRRQVDVQVALLGGLHVQFAGSEVDLFETGKAVDDDRRVLGGGIGIAHQREAGGVPQRAVVHHGEGAGAGQVLDAIRAVDDEEALAVDGKVRRRGRIGEGALRGNGIAHIRGDAARIVGAAGGGQDQRGELGRGLLVARRVRIRDVVGDRAQAIGLGIHAGNTRSHRTVKAHVNSPFVSSLQPYETGLA